MPPALRPYMGGRRGDRRRCLIVRWTSHAARILISNDDGIEAPGLKLLDEGRARAVARRLGGRARAGAERRQPLADPAPAAARAAARAAALRRRRHADRLRAAGRQARSSRTSGRACVLSGINAGGNLGEDVTYSGTVAAAMEATLLDVPAIAMSQHTADDRPLDWAAAERYARRGDPPPAPPALAAPDAHQRQFPRRRGRQGHRHRRDRARTAQGRRQSGRAGRSARPRVLLDRPDAGGARRHQRDDRTGHRSRRRRRRQSSADADLSRPHQ